MTAVLALSLLFDAVVARFTSESAATWQAPLFTGSGTSQPSVDDASAPTGGHDLFVRVTTGGTVGVDGIVYQTSDDGGATWGPLTDLHTATSIVLDGVTIHLGTGTLVAADEIEVVTTAATVPPENVFGWREPAHRDGLSLRIVWVPGDDKSGDLGKFKSARQPGRNPRPLQTIGELATVYVEGYDASDPENERTQYEATRLLADAWLRAVYLAAHGTYEIQSAGWITDKATRRKGAALRFVIALDAMVPDAPLATVTPTEAVVEVELGDTTEELDVTAS